MKPVNGYTQNAWEGDKYAPGLGVKEIAARIRVEIASAIRSKDLPWGKYSVTIDRYSGGQSIDIRVREFEFKVLNPERLLRPDASEHECPRLTRIAKLTLERLEAMLNEYRRSDCDSMIDYFNVNFYGHASFDWKLEESERS